MTDKTKQAGERPYERCFLAGCHNESRCLAPDHCEAEAQSRVANIRHATYAAAIVLALSHAKANRKGK